MNIYFSDIPLHRQQDSKRATLFILNISCS